MHRYEAAVEQYMRHLFPRNAPIDLSRWSRRC